MKLLDELRRALDPEQPLIVAVSGGADSVALLAAVCELEIPVTAAHVNHGLRGSESDGDEQFVRELAGQLGVECVVERVEIAGPSLEAVARKARYQVLENIAGRGQIATAHTLDDQAETVLHRLIRGCGLGGLAGIQPRRRLGQALLIRPWLSVPRQDLRDYLQDRGLARREDSSNADLKFTRNRLRRELLPQLQSFNPQIIRQLGRLAEQARDYQQRERRRIRRVLAKVELPRAGLVAVFHAGKLASLARPVLRGLWPAVWRREGWPAGALDFATCDRLAGLCLGEAHVADLPGGIRARRLDRVVRLGPDA